MKIFNSDKARLGKKILTIIIELDDQFKYNFQQNKMWKETLCK